MVSTINTNHWLAILNEIASVRIVKQNDKNGNHQIIAMNFSSLIINRF